MKAVVTGATGFVGKNIVNELLLHDVEVLAVVRNMDLIPKEWEGKVNFIKMNFFNETEYVELLNYQADLFFHFAWAATSGNMRGNVDLQLDNVRYSCKLMRIAKKMGCSRFIFAGSIMEYEAMEYIAKDFSLPSQGMIYSTAKLTADFMLKTLSQGLKIDYINVLISNIYGVGERSARFLNTILGKMIRNEPIELTHCEQLYDFIYMTDAAKAIVASGMRGKSLSTYYIGNKTVCPLKNYIGIMMRVTGSNSKLFFGKIPYNNALLSYTEFDMSKVENELGVKYEYNFETGIKKTMEWMKLEG